MTTLSNTGRRWRLAALAFAMLLPSAGTSIANAALPTLTTAFGVSSQDVQWVVIAYLLATTTLVVAAGRLGDMLGRRRVLLVGVAVFTTASVAAGLAPSLWLLVLARAVQGLGAAAMMALAIAAIGDLVRRERAGAAMGLLGSVSAIGTALGPSLGGALIAASGWQAVFGFLAVLGTVTFVLGLLTLPRDPVPPGSHVGLDLPGTGALAIALGAYALATTVKADLQTSALLAAIALAATVVFVFMERAAAAPLVQLGELRDGEITAGLVSIALVSVIMMSTLVVGPFYLSHVLALDPLATGLVMSVGPAVAVIAGIPAGRLVDRIGAGRVAVFGLAGLAIGAMLMALLPSGAGIPGYLTSLPAITAGYALFQSANNTSVMASADGGRRGAIAGLLALARNLGLITGASAMGAVFAGASQLPGGAEAGMRTTFLVATMIAIVAIVVTFQGRKRRIA